MIALFRLLIFSVIVARFLSGCEREDFDPSDNVRLKVSTDSILFDTVFTQRSTITKRFKIFNPAGRAILIDEIKLEDRANGVYRLNVDGNPVNKAAPLRNYRIGANDSLFVFVEATADSTGEAQPFVITDHVNIQNGTHQLSVTLESWGQNAYYHDNDSITQNTTWGADLPHLVYGTTWVAPGASLEIEKGAEIYFHSSSFLAVLGNLRVEGSPHSRVLMRSDRLEDAYRDQAGQWQGVFLLSPSQANRIYYADIQNSVIGVRVDSLGLGPAPKLDMEGTRITNVESAALAAFTGEVDARNCEFSNGCEGAFVADLGGAYRFRHVTFANFPRRCGSITPAVRMVERNFEVPEAGIDQPLDLLAEFTNCVIAGNQPNEIVIEEMGAGRVNAQFDHCALQTDQRQALQTRKCLFNRDSLFADRLDGIFEPDSLSPLVAAGKPTSLNFDLEGRSRDPQNPDIGAYELP